MGHLDIYDRLAKPPKDALRAIAAGRLKGKTDINPQWRYKAMTELFGPCGIGWKIALDKTWTEPASDGQVFAFAMVHIVYRDPASGEWSDPLPGIGGNMLLAQEKTGLHANDEAYKMAVTDAIGTALKLIGVGADVYAGKWDGAKYLDGNPGDTAPKAAKQRTPAQQPSQQPSQPAENTGGPPAAKTPQRSWKDWSPQERFQYTAKRIATAADMAALSGIASKLQPEDYTPEDFMLLNDTYADRMAQIERGETK